MADYKTYAKQKWGYFFLALTAYFAPMITVISVFFPLLETDVKVKVGAGCLLLVANGYPFLKNLYRSFTVHFPLFNAFAVGFVCVGFFLATDFFRYYVEIFIWIEAAAAAGSLLACFFWHQYRKYARARESVKSVEKSGMLRVINEGDKK